MIAGVIAALVAVGLVAFFLLRDDGEPAAGADVPVEVTPQELRDFAESGDRVVYWASFDPDQGFRLELTKTAEGNVFVRYLTQAAVVGDRRPSYTTIGTYPLDDAYAVARRRARNGWMNRPAPGGAIAIWRAAHPASVYLAYPEVNHLVEVYDPRPSAARELALSSRVERVGQT